MGIGAGEVDVVTIRQRYADKEKSAGRKKPKLDYFHRGWQEDNEAKRATREREENSTEEGNMRFQGMRSMGSVPVRRHAMRGRGPGKNTAQRGEKCGKTIRPVIAMCLQLITWGCGW